MIREQELEQLLNAYTKLHAWPTFLDEVPAGIVSARNNRTDYHKAVGLHSTKDMWASAQTASTHRGTDRGK